MEIGMDNLNYLCPLMASKLTVPARKKAYHQCENAMRTSAWCAEAVKK